MTRKRKVTDREHLLAQLQGGEPEDFLPQDDDYWQPGKRPSGPIPFDDGPLTGEGFKKVATYPYTDPEDGPLNQVLRYEHPKVPGVKLFRQRRRAGGERGLWMAEAGLIKVIYNWPDVVKRPDEIVHFCEGEKDADRLMKEGLLATTVAGQKWSPEAALALVDRDVVVLEDNDPKGRDHAQASFEALRGIAAQVRIVQLPGLPLKGDVSDWLDAGHTVDELKEIADATRPAGVEPSVFDWIEPEDAPKRDWLYPPHYIRKFVSLIVSTGGVGKSSLALVEALSLVSCRALLGVQPHGQYRVWYWNGEDPFDELQRRIAAATKHHELAPSDIAERLFVNSGRDLPIVIAEEIRREVVVNEAEVQEIIATIRERKIDVVIIDPFIACHRVGENDNAAIERVAKVWARVAEEGNCAVMLIHHSRKTGGESATVDDGRGASALLAAARNARVLNTMTEAEAKPAEIELSARRTYFRADVGKANLYRPATSADWYELTNIDLGNSPDTFVEDSDQVGVVAAWEYPTIEPMVLLPHQIETVHNHLRKGGPWRADHRVTTEPWVGAAIAEVLDIDITDDVKKRSVVDLVKAWIHSGSLKKYTGKDAGGRIRDYVKVGLPPPDIPAGAM